MQGRTDTRKKEVSSKINYRPFMYLGIIGAMLFCNVTFCFAVPTQVTADAEVQFWILPDPGVTFTWKSGPPPNQRFSCPIVPNGKWLGTDSEEFATFYKISGNGNITIEYDYTVSSYYNII